MQSGSGARQTARQAARWSDRWLLTFASALRLDASPQGLHDVDDICGLALLWSLDFLAGLLLLEQLFDCIFVLILESGLVPRALNLLLLLLSERSNGDGL
jgi:hypothetical protein